jgi:hypothetical protein
MVTLSSEGSSSSASSSSESSSLGVCGAPAEKEISLVETSKPVLSSQEVEDPAIAHAVNPISTPHIDAKLIILSSGSEDKVDWEALIADDEVD